VSRLFPIETPRLTLREWTAADLPAMGLLYGDPDTMRYIGHGRPLGAEEVERDLRATLRRYRLHGMGMGCIEDRAGGRVLGHCGLQRWDGTLDVELGYLLRPDARGRGLATEAAEAVVARGFEAFRPKRIVAILHPENAPSIALAERLGMAYFRETEYKGRTGLSLYALGRPDRSGQ
jgi:RimJ/RimL family protein N-acetyltransferase